MLFIKLHHTEQIAKLQESARQIGGDYDRFLNLIQRSLLFSALLNLVVHDHYFSHPKSVFFVPMVYVKECLVSQRWSLYASQHAPKECRGSKPKIQVCKVISPPKNVYPLSIHEA
jgi:hypothetical protein